MIASSQASAITQCPHCSAKFRVRAEQVKLHAGLVRCGACRGIFDAIEHLVEGTLPRNLADETHDGEPPQTIIQGMPSVQQRADAAANPPPHAHAHPPAQGHASAGAPVAPSAPAAGRARPPEAPAAGPRTSADAAAQAMGNAAPKSERRGGPVPANHATTEETFVQNVDAKASTLAGLGVGPEPVDARDRYRWRQPDRKASTLSRWVYAALSLLASIALIGQTAYFFRDEIAIRAPSLAGPLAMACERLGCRVQPPKRAESLGFVGADLAADPAHKGLLIFTVTLRNSGERAVVYPHLVLTLDGLGGEMVARRVFSPKEFAPANANLLQGLAGGAEIEIKLYLDASQANVVGFKVDHAYL